MATQPTRRPPPRKRRRVRRAPLLQRLRNNFLTGLVLVAPLFLTIYLVWLFVGFVDDRVLPWIPTRYNPETWVGQNIPGIGLVFFFLITTAVGWGMKGLFGRQILRFGEQAVDRMPIVRPVYNAIKQIVETIFAQSQSSFKQACLIEYPRKGLWAVAFVATETRGEVAEKAEAGEMLSVFLPTTPNPTSGFLLFVPREDVHVLDMSVEDAAKLVISAGLVLPPPATEPAKPKAAAKPGAKNMDLKA